MKTDWKTYLFFTIGVGLFAIICTGFTVSEYYDFLLCEKNKVTEEVKIVGNETKGGKAIYFKLEDDKGKNWEVIGFGKYKLGDKLTIVYNSKDLSYIFPIEEYGKKHRIGFLISIALNSLLIYVLLKRKSIKIIRRPYHG